CNAFLRNDSSPTTRIEASIDNEGAYSRNFILKGSKDLLYGEPKLALEITVRTLSFLQVYPPQMSYIRVVFQTRKQ
ncbi:MAG TPA: hypothetical protein V6C78_13645, partial [Crinalium sp.]